MELLTNFISPGEGQAVLQREEVGIICISIPSAYRLTTRTGTTTSSNTQYSSGIINQPVQMTRSISGS